MKQNSLGFHLYQKKLETYFLKLQNLSFKRIQIECFKLKIFSFANYIRVINGIIIIYFYLKQQQHEIVNQQGYSGSTTKLNYNQIHQKQENFRNIIQLTRNQNTLQNNQGNKDEQLWSESTQQIKQKNYTTFIQPVIEKQKIEAQNIEEPQQSHRSNRGQTSDSIINLQQNLKLNTDHQQKKTSGLNQNIIDEILNNTNTAPLPTRSSTTHSNSVNQNFIQMLQTNAQRKNKENSNIPYPQNTQQTLNSKGKTATSSNSISASTVATSQTATQFYTLDDQSNNTSHQIFTQSAGFNSLSNSVQKKVNLQVASTASIKNLSQKKLFESCGFNSSNSVKQNQQKKSNSLQRQIGNSKQQNQTAQFTGQNILDRVSIEYFQKLMKNFKPKFISDTENTLKIESSQSNFQEILFNTQIDGKPSHLIQQEKIDIEKAVEQEYMKNIKEINKDLILKKKQFIDSTNQQLCLSNSNNKNNNSYGLKNNQNDLRNSNEKLSSQQIESQYGQRNRSQQQQTSYAKKLKSFYDSKQSYKVAKNMNSFDAQMKSTSSSFYKSNSLTKKDSDKQSKLNLKQILKQNLPVKPSLAQNKVSQPSKPKSSQKKQQSCGFKTIFGSNIKGFQAIDVIQSSQNKVSSGEIKDKNQQLLESNYQAQVALNMISNSQQPKIQSKDTQNTRPSSQQKKSSEVGLNMYVSQVKQSQMQQYLTCPRNNHDSIDNIDVDLKLSKRHSRDVDNSKNRQSQNEISQSLPYSEVNQIEIQHRKNRIQTPINIGFCYYNTSMDMHSRYPSQDDYFCNVFRQHFIQTYHALNFCKSLEPIDALILESKLIQLPFQPIKKKTIVFDLDETLIHCNEDPNLYSDVIIPIKFPNGEVLQTGINIRPYAKECLKELSKHFEIIVFTASHSCYAERVIEYLDPNRNYIDLILSRDNCVQTQEGVHIKDLRIFNNRNLKDIVIVDNAAYSFGFQIENGIPIIPFFDNKKDMELKYLVDFLKKLLEVNDVREFLHKTFKMRIYSECDTIEEALERVYGIQQQSSRIDFNEGIEQQNYFESNDLENQNQQIIDNYDGQYNDEDDLERDDLDNFEYNNEQQNYRV